MRCLKIPKKKGEEVRNKLLEDELLYKDGKIETTDKHIFLPIKEDAVNKLSDLENFDYEIVKKDIEERKKVERDYKKRVDIPEEKREYLPSSYDIIGEIALLKIPEDIIDYRFEIGKAILETHKNLKSVFLDKGVKGQFRIRDLENLAGENNTETVHKEHGSEMLVDVENAYFSPRLATERWRVVNCVNDGEVVLDMFAGVGPYTVLIGNNIRVKHIHSIDLNPDAVKYLTKNVQKNDLQDIVTVHEGDAEKISPDLSCDRVIMNLPHSTKSFIDPALSAIKSRGIIHYYEILEEDDEERRREEVLNKIESKGFSVELKNKRVVRTYSVTEIQMVYDLFVERKRF